jgi:transcriptional regulator with XRE-family HTH domain
MTAAPNHLRAWRLHRGLTQQQLAERVETTKAVIGNLENGGRGLSERWLRLLGPALGVTAGVLLDRGPTDPPAILELWSRIPPDRRELARDVLRGFTA